MSIKRKVLLECVELNLCLNSFYTQIWANCVLMLCFENPVSAKGEAVWMSTALKKAASNNAEVRPSTRTEHVHESRGPFVTSSEGTKKLLQMKTFQLPDLLEIHEEIEMTYGICITFPKTYCSTVTYSTDNYPQLMFSWCLHCMIFTIYLAY